MSVYKDKNSWWINLRHNHQRYRYRSPENTKAGAQAYEAVVRQQLARGEPVGKAIRKQEQVQTFGQFAPHWFETYVVTNNKNSEQVTKRNILDGSLIPFFGKLPITKINAHQIDLYKAQMSKQGITNKTIKNRLSVLNKCLTTAYEWLELDGTPPKIKWPKCIPPQMDHLSPDECELLLSKAGDIEYELILTAIRTGMRQGELKGLQWSSIDWQNRNITVQHSRDDRSKQLTSPKSNRIRHIPMDIDVYELLYRRKKETGYVFTRYNGQPFTHNLMSRLLRDVRGKAGLRSFGWHTLRHTFASHLTARGVPMTAVQQLMGHSNISTTMRYAHLAPSALRNAIDLLNPKTAANIDFGQPVVSKWMETQSRRVSQKIPVPKNP